MKASDRTQAELEALDNLPDSAIDTSDIPESADWTGASRGRFYRPAQKPVPVRLDSDVVAYFKKAAGARGRYQTEINRALREWIAARSPSTNG